METNAKRVLAYHLATEISPEELAQVSGGALQGTGRHTIQITGGPTANADLSYDYQND